MLNCAIEMGHTQSERVRHDFPMRYKPALANGVRASPSYLRRRDDGGARREHGVRDRPQDQQLLLASGGYGSVSRPSLDPLPP